MLCWSDILYSLYYKYRCTLLDISFETDFLYVLNVCVVDQAIWLRWTLPTFLKSVQWIYYKEGQLTNVYFIKWNVTNSFINNMWGKRAENNICGGKVCWHNTIVRGIIFYNGMGWINCEEWRGCKKKNSIVGVKVWINTLFPLIVSPTASCISSRCFDYLCKNEMISCIIHST